MASDGKVTIEIDGDSALLIKALEELKSIVSAMGQAMGQSLSGGLSSATSAIEEFNRKITETGNKTSGSVGFYSGGMFFSGAGDKITGQGRAIYVTEEEQK